MGICKICGNKIYVYQTKELKIGVASFEVCSSCRDKWDAANNKELLQQLLTPSTDSLLVNKINERIKIVSEEEELYAINDIYEYDSCVVYDARDGSTNISELNEALNRYGSRGWKLVSMTTNELGKDSVFFSNIIGRLGLGTNATIDQTVLVFERCIKRYK